MRIFTTFKGSVYLSKKGNSNLILNWSDVSDECGESIKGDFTSEQNEYLKGLKLKVGNRYMIECHDIKTKKITEISDVKSVFKNKRCEIMRKANGTFHFIKGKYKSKKLEDIDVMDVNNYMIWLAKNSNNEATIKNSLEVLALVNKIS